MERSHGTEQYSESLFGNYISTCSEPASRSSSVTAAIRFCWTVVAWSEVRGHKRPCRIGDVYSMWVRRDLPSTSEVLSEGSTIRQTKVSSKGQSSSDRTHLIHHFKRSHLPWSEGHQRPYRFWPMSTVEREAINCETSISRS